MVLRIVLLSLLAALAPSLTWAQGRITTVAGSTGSFPAAANGGPAIDAPLLSVTGVAVDTDGNIYVADSEDNTVARIAPNGVITVIAGNRGVGFSGDGGPAVSAQLYGPGPLAVDAAGNLYIAVIDRVRKVTPAGVISTVAGNGQSGFSGDGGAATSAQLSGLVGGLAVDSGGNLYIADGGNSRIRKVTPEGTISTIAGNGQFGFSGDGGPAAGAQLNSPWGLAFDIAGNLYFADVGNNRIRSVTPAGTIGTVAGMPGSTGGFSGDGGPAVKATLAHPLAVTLDAAGDLYIADSYNSRIRRVTPAGTISTVAGNGGTFLGDGGPAAGAWLGTATNGVAADNSGNLYIADGGNNRIRKVTPEGTISTIVGSGQTGFSGDGGPATTAQLFAPFAVTVDAGGNLYISDMGNNRIRKVTPGGTITTVAGIAQRGLTGGFSGDGGPATSAELYGPQGLAVDASGNLYIADWGNNRIRKVALDGTISTVAGNGQPGFSGDGGAAINARLNAPSGVAVDAAGNLYIADSLNHSIRKVDGTGTITTIAGNQQGSFSGDGGPANRAALCVPRGVAVDAAGNLYITDSGNNRIRKVDIKGTISTVAGNGAADFSGDGGPSTCAALNLNYNDYGKVGGGAGLDSAGNLYIADWLNQRVRKVTPPALPCFVGSSVVNGASFLAGASAPGSIVSIFGYDLASDVQVSGSAALPTQLLDTTVTINNVAAPLFFVSPGQINAQIPFEVPTGTAPIQVMRANTGAAGAATSSLLIALVSPGIFISGGPGSSQGAILTSTGEIAGPSGSLPGHAVRPAHHGEFISIFLTGLGDVTNRPASGAPAPIPPPYSEARLTPTLTIGGVTAVPVFSGLAPLFVGLYQVNAQVPDAVPAGDAIQVVLSVGGAASNAVTIAVQ